MPTVAKGSLHLDRTIPIGKWPEGVVVLGDVAWVAESGQRRVSRVSLAGEAPQRHVSVGRLPVDIALAPNGKLYTVAKTDNTLWEIDPKTSTARIFATVRDYAQSMTIADGGVWILQWLKGTSTASSVVRVDLASRKQTTSPKTGANAWAIGFEAGRAWVALGDGSLTSLDGSSLQNVRQVTAPGPPGSARGLVTSDGAVFTEANQQIVRTDVATGLRTHRVTLPEKVALLSASQGAIVVVGARSTIWLLDPATLTILRELTSSVPWEWPHGLARYGDAFVLTDHGQDGDHGRLHVLSSAPSPPGLSPHPAAR